MCPENPVLFPTMRPTFIEQGHSFVDRIEDCDVVLWDLHTRIANYSDNDIQYLLSNKIPTVSFDEWDRGNMSNDKWPFPFTVQQSYVFVELLFNKIKNIHFCRLVDKTQKWPDNVFPYEKPISYEQPPVSKEELFNREWDIVFVANHAPSRQLIADAINNDGRLKCLTMIGAEKIPFEKFVEIHKTGKLFISSSGGGFTDERVQCLFSIAGIIRQRTNQLLLNDFTNSHDCIRISSPTTKDDLDYIYQIVNDKDRLYEIYLNGYNFVKTHYSQEYFANYYLETMRKNNII